MKAAVGASDILDFSNLVEFCRQIGVDQVVGNLSTVTGYRELGYPPLKSLMGEGRTGAYVTRLNEVGLNVPVFQLSIGETHLETRSCETEFWLEGKPRHNNGKPSENVLRTIENLGLSGVEVLTLFASFRWFEDGKKRAEQYKYAVEYYERLVGKAEQANLNLATHTRVAPNRFFYDDYEANNAFLEAVSSKHNGICLCPGTIIAGKDDPVETIGKYKEKIHHVHMRDVRRIPVQSATWGSTTYNIFGPISRQTAHNDFGPPNLKGERVVDAVPGNGMVDWPSIIEALQDIGYEGLVQTEHYISMFGDNSASVAGAVGYLKGLIDAITR